MVLEKQIIILILNIGWLDTPGVLRIVNVASPKAIFSEDCNCLELPGTHEFEGKLPVSFDWWDDRKLFAVAIGSNFCLLASNSCFEAKNKKLEKKTIDL